MSQTFWILLAVFVAVDIAVVVWAVRSFMSRMLGSTLGVQTGKVIETAHAMIGEYMRVNYSGDRTHLTAALGGLLPVLHGLLQSQGVSPRPEVIRALLEISLSRHRIASVGEVREALAVLEGTDGAEAGRREAA